MQQIISIHVLAPDKPAIGQPCNGCGVCCAAAPCPVSLALLPQKQRACVALQWSDPQQRYFCGMVVAPKDYIKWLPTRLNQTASRIFKRWIAAGQACDSDAVLIDDQD